METRNCQNCKNDFEISEEDFKFYERIKVPPPTFCPECRFQRRLLFRNNRVFYRRECDLCKKSILSVYNKEKPYIIYCRECWLSDKWSPIDYGREYDFSKPFFEQFEKLRNAVPRINLYQDNFKNSEYSNYGIDFKECYLLFGGRDNERIYFGNQLIGCKDSVDIVFSEKTEFSCSLFECQRTNKLFFSEYSSDCIDSWYLSDCKNCINCFGCVGLINKQYFIFNKQYSKEEYINFVKEQTGSYKKHLVNLNKWEKLKLSLPHRFARIYKSINSSGDDAYELKNSNNVFASGEVEDSKFLFFCKRGVKDCYDNSFAGFKSELVYENAHSFGGNEVIAGLRSFDSQKLKYSEDCHNCISVFGCEGLRKKNYCILNKQYSKQDYEEILPKIIKHMEEMPYVDRKGRTYKYGEFFPSNFSSFSYNESIAQEYFPLTEDEATSFGFTWKKEKERNYKIDLITEDIPDNISDISDISDEIVKNIISCEHKGNCKDQCTEAFKITSEEFKFYKSMSLPLPRRCPNCRHYDLISKRNPLKLWKRSCMCQKKDHYHDSKCVVEFKTTYSPNRLEIIYCEKCYQQEVY